MDRADEIAQELAQTIWGGALINEAEQAIAAALRSYGDEKLEEAAKAVEDLTGLENAGEAKELRLRARLIRSLKSQPIQEKT